MEYQITHKRISFKKYPLNIYQTTSWFSVMQLGMQCCGSGNVKETCNTTERAHDEVQSYLPRRSSVDYAIYLIFFILNIPYFSLEWGYKSILQSWEADVTLFQNHISSVLSGLLLKIFTDLLQPYQTWFTD